MMRSLSLELVACLCGVACGYSQQRRGTVCDQLCQEWDSQCVVPGCQPAAARLAWQLQLVECGLTLSVTDVAHMCVFIPLLLPACLPNCLSLPACLPA